MPLLQDITISNDDPRVELSNNPNLKKRVTTKATTKNAVTFSEEWNTEEVEPDIPEEEIKVVQVKNATNAKKEGLLEGEGFQVFSQLLTIFNRQS